MEVFSLFFWVPLAPALHVVSESLRTDTYSTTTTYLAVVIGMPCVQFRAIKVKVKGSMTDRQMGHFERMEL